MRVRILASAPDDPREAQFLTSFLINDTVAIDAGCAGFCGTPQDQARINHVFLTHSHADHVCSLPMLVTNAHDERGECVAVYGHEHVLGSLRTDVFNGRMWPNLLRLTGKDEALRLARVESEQRVEADGLVVTPVFVNHAVPTFGYVVEDDSSAVVFCSDTAPTERIWEVARGKANLKALFLGVSFPEEMAELARVAAHLTPTLFRDEVAKLSESIDVVAVHIKPGHRDQVVRELQALQLRSLRIGAGGVEYRF